MADFGTHFLAQAKMGARFEPTIFFTENTTSDTRSEVKEEVSSNSFAFSLDASGSRGAISGEGGVSAGFENSYNHKEQ